MEEIFKQLIQFECQLHHTDQKNLNILDQYLHTDFKEFTKSGRVVHKAEMINALLNDVDSDIIHAQDFQFQPLSNQSILLTYLSYQVNSITQNKYNFALRSSIWIMNNQGLWQMIFHQGTPQAQDGDDKH